MLEPKQYTSHLPQILAPHLQDGSLFPPAGDGFQDFFSEHLLNKNQRHFASSSLTRTFFHSTHRPGSGAADLSLGHFLHLKPMRAYKVHSPVICSPPRTEQMRLATHIVPNMTRNQAGYIKPAHIFPSYITLQLLVRYIFQKCKEMSCPHNCCHLQREAAHLRFAFRKAILTQPQYTVFFQVSFICVVSHCFCHSAREMFGLM